MIEFQKGNNSPIDKVNKRNVINGKPGKEGRLDDLKDPVEN